MERQLMEEGGVDSEEYQRFAAGPGNVANDGMFSIQVRAAAAAAGCACAPQAPAGRGAGRRSWLEACSGWSRLGGGGGCGCRRAPRRASLTPRPARAQVLSQALQVWNVQVTNLESPDVRDAKAEPQGEQAFICNLQVRARLPGGALLRRAQPRAQPSAWSLPAASARHQRLSQPPCSHTRARAGALVHHQAHRGRRLLELQLAVPGAPAAVPVLPGRLPGQPQAAGLHHLRGGRLGGWR
jgi:hypothetical protein